MNWKTQYKAQRHPQMTSSKTDIIWIAGFVLSMLGCSETQTESSANSKIAEINAEITQMGDLHYNNKALADALRADTEIRLVLKTQDGKVLRMIEGRGYTELRGALINEIDIAVANWPQEDTNPLFAPTNKDLAKDSQISKGPINRGVK